MIWKIARKDLLLNLMTFKFLAGTIICLVLSVFNRGIESQVYDSVPICGYMQLTRTMPMSIL